MMDKEVAFGKTLEALRHKAALQGGFIDKHDIDEMLAPLELDDTQTQMVFDYLKGRGIRWEIKLSGEEARKVLAAGIPTLNSQLPTLNSDEIEVSLYDQIWQAGAILLSTVRSVGVMGDERTYEHPVALRAVTSTDAMTADWAHLPYDFMAKVSNEIINKVRGVNRVCYDISSKPPATIEWE